MSTIPDRPFTDQILLRELVQIHATALVSATIDSKDPTLKAAAALLNRLLKDDSKFDELFNQYIALKRDDLNIPASRSTLAERCSEIVQYLVSAASSGGTPKVKVTFSTATKTITDSLNLRIVCAGPLTEARIADFTKIVDRLHSCGLAKRIDDLLRAEGGNLDPERDRLTRVGMSNETACRLLIDLALNRAVALSKGLTGKREGFKVEVALAEAARSSENATGPVDVTARDGKIYSFTGIVDYVVTLSQDDLRDLPAKLVRIAVATELQMFILEAKHKMTEEELMRHLPQLATQAIVTIKVLRWKALACILSDGFQYIFAVVECVDETSDKYELCHYDSFRFISNDGIPALDKAKQLLAMTASWGVLDPKRVLARKAKGHAGSIQPSI